MSQFWGKLLGLAIGLVIAAILLAASAYGVWSGRRKLLEPVLRELGAKLVFKLFGSNYMLIDNHGMEVRIGLTRRDERGEDFYLTQIFPTSLRFDLEMWPKDREDPKFDQSLFKKFVVGVPEIDNKYWTASKDPFEAANYYLHPQRRQAIDYFFSQGFDKFEGGADKVTFSTGGLPGGYQNPQRIRNYLEKLYQLAKA